MMKKLLSLLLTAALVLSLGSAAALAEGETSTAPKIVVDGVKDAAYVEEMSFPSSYWSFYDGNTTSYYPADEERIRNTLYFNWDDEFVYVYFQCESEDPLFQKGEYASRSEVPTGTFMEAISIYLDTAPSAPVNQATNNDGTQSSDFDRNCISGAAPEYRLMARYTPAFDECWNYFVTDAGMFLTLEEFTERYKERFPADEMEAYYKKYNGAAEFKGFIDYETNTYGCEFKYPRAKKADGKPEDNFRINITTSANEKDWGGDIGYEIPYTISFGPAWWRNFDALQRVYYDDYKDIADVDPAVIRVINLIRNLPDPENVTLGDEANIVYAQEAFDALTEAQQEKVDEESYTKLFAVSVVVEVLKIIANLGDVNGDKVVDAKDALLVLRAAVGKAELTEDQMLLADVNGDEEINAKDALLILQKAVNKIEKFPVEEMLTGGEEA